MRLRLGSALVLGVLQWFMVTVLWAQQSDVPGSSDYPAAQRYPGSTIVDYNQASNAVYELPLGRMQRVDGRVSASQSERLQGQLTRITYAIPSGFTGGDAYRFFREQLLSGNQSVLFECEGRGCGSSNFWANDVFGNRILYGPESNQYYLASTYQTERDGREVSGYAALYVITRGNRRVYAHLDFMQLSEDVTEVSPVSVTPEAVLLRLQQEGGVVIQNLRFDDNDELVDDSGIELIVRALRRDVLLQVYIVGHLRAEAQLDTLLQRSHNRAEQVRDALVAAGIDTRRLNVQGVGPLAPHCRPGPCHERIELVLR